MAALVESSILQFDQAVRPPRYSMLGPLRHYGRQRLRELGEEVLMQTRHRDWILRLARCALTFDEKQLEGLRTVHRERGNVWSAMDFSRRQAGHAITGHEICTALTNYWLARGPLRDVRRYLESLLPLAEPDSPFRAQCLTGLALFSNALDDAVTARGDWTAWWAYLAGPVAGAAIAVGIAFILRGRGGDRSGIAAAQGTIGVNSRSGRGPRP